jgi:hypothetical protein
MINDGGLRSQNALYRKSAQLRDIVSEGRRSAASNKCDARNIVRYSAYLLFLIVHTRGGLWQKATVNNHLQHNRYGQSSMQMPLYI